ncbi:hypothetical protein B566_EDAN010327 [Ephemera danica]|nr:hypothetical protein B566_EDAN010327 [Ephemera danica]
MCDRYTVYSVNAEQLKGSAWQVSTALVVICGSVPDSLVSALTSYLLRGGKLLCLCSDLLHMVLPEFRTAEVRTNELVTFSYQRWKKIKMLHHVFCYQQSPVHSRFGDQNTKGLTPATAVELKDREGLSHKLDVSVLGVEETWHTPSLILAKSSAGGGKVIFSQVHLEVDPLQYESDNTTYASLKQSNTARLEIMRDILGTQLGLECAEGSKEATPTMGYFLGRHELKTEFLTSVKSRLGSSCNTLEMDNLVLQFCGKGATPSQPSHSILPVMLHSCPPHFNTLEYFDNLTTEALGRLVVYADVMTSSMEPLSGAPLWHGMAAVPRQQLTGRGRGGNEWLSPEGCGMFTLQLHLPLNSNLGRRVSLIQHITALAIVIAIREAKGYEDIDLRLKWPNDIYAGNWAKVGGLIVTSSIMGQKVCCNIGCALNLANSEPTTCIQDLLRECNSNAPPLTLEKYLALTFSRLESMIEAAQNTDEGLDDILKVYYAYWLHR